MYLNDDVDQNYKDRVDQREEEPNLDWLDSGGGGQTGGDREVDGGQHHHAGDVDGIDCLVLVRGGDVVCGLVNQVHEDGGQVSDQYYANNVPTKMHCVDQSIIFFNSFCLLNCPLNIKLSERSWSSISKTI